MQSSLPVYNFPDKVGYVAPGVCLFILDMEENQGNNWWNVFSTHASPATISVASKPKMLCGCSVTNWANCAYADRILFPETGRAGLSRDIQSLLIFI